MKQGLAAVAAAVFSLESKTCSHDQMGAGRMNRHGLDLENADVTGILTCPESGLRNHEASPGVLRCLDLDEDAAPQRTSATAAVRTPSTHHHDKQGADSLGGLLCRPSRGYRSWGNVRL